MANAIAGAARWAVATLSAIVPTMHTTPADSLDDLANNYAVRWAAERPVPDRARPADGAELHDAPAANEAFHIHQEFLPNYSRCGINE